MDGSSSVQSEKNHRADPTLSRPTTTKLALATLKFSNVNMRSVLRTRKQLDNHLLESFHILICLQLILTYLYDLSLLRLISGYILQAAFLSPLIRDVVPIPRSFDRRSILVILVGYDILLMVSHVTNELPRPVPGSPFLHGGLTIEFVGVRPLTSRIPLVLGDIYMFFMQITAFCMIFTPKSGTTARPEPNDIVDTGTAAATSPEPSSSAESSSLSSPALVGSSNNRQASERNLLLSGKVIVREVSIFSSIALIWRQEAERRRALNAPSQAEQQRNLQDNQV